MIKAVFQQNKPINAPTPSPRPLPQPGSPPELESFEIVGSASYTGVTNVSKIPWTCLTIYMQFLPELESKVRPCVRGFCQNSGGNDFLLV